MKGIFTLNPSAAKDFLLFTYPSAGYVIPQKGLNISHNGLFSPQMGLIKINLYPLRGRSQNCIMEILSARAKNLDVRFRIKAPLKTFQAFGRNVTYFESCGMLRKHAWRNSSQSKKLKGNLPIIGQLVSHTSKKATKANCRKEFSCSFRELSWKAHGVDAIIVCTNTHSIVSDCHWLFISGHEDFTSDYRRYYPPGTRWRMFHVMCHVGETFVKLYSYDVIICHIWGTYQRILAFSHSVFASH